MTREELREHCERQIQQFERVEKIMPVTLNDWKRYEEHKLILELLEQEPCEDCISRKDIYFKLTNGAYSNETIEQFIDRLVKELEALPPVKPQEPKTGEWIKQNDDYFDWYECSECGYGSEGEMQYSSENDVRTNYCPCCGARMEEVEE